MENVPAVVDLVTRTKERFRVAGSAPHGVDERLRLIQEENLKLGKALLETTEHLQQLAKTLEVVAARQKMLAIASVVSLVTAICSLLLWL